MSKAALEALDRQIALLTDANWFCLQEHEKITPMGRGEIERLLADLATIRAALEAKGTATNTQAVDAMGSAPPATGPESGRLGPSSAALEAKGAPGEAEAIRLLRLMFDEFPLVTGHYTGGQVATRSHVRAFLDAAPPAAAPQDSKLVSRLRAVGFNEVPPDVLGPLAFNSPALVPQFTQADLDEIRSQAEQGVFVEHDCPAMFACACILGMFGPEAAAPSPTEDKP